MPLSRRAAVYAEQVNAGLEATARNPALVPDVDRFHVHGLIDRESGHGAYLTPPGPAGTGDHGNGFGLGQFDKNPHEEPRYHDAQGVPNDVWIATSGDWQDPAKNIARTCDQLRWGIEAIVGDCSDPVWALPASIAAYNAGVPSVKRALTTIPSNSDLSFVIGVLDTITTDKNYVSDVLFRAERFAA